MMWTWSEGTRSGISSQYGDSHPTKRQRITGTWLSSAWYTDLVYRDEPIDGDMAREHYHKPELLIPEISYRILLVPDLGNHIIELITGGQGS